MCIWKVSAQTLCDCRAFGRVPTNAQQMMPRRKKANKATRRLFVPWQSGWKRTVRNKKKISQIAWKTPHESKCPHLSIFSSTVIPVHIWTHRCSHVLTHTISRLWEEIWLHSKYNRTIGEFYAIIQFTFLKGHCDCSVKNTVGPKYKQKYQGW